MDINYLDLIQDFFPDVVQLRHELHAHPEIRFKEEWTSNRIGAFLEKHMIPCDRGFANGTGLVATLRGKMQHTVALRADMDALPITEETNAPYASVYPGMMHACGHDGHMATVCGVAAILAAFRERLKANVKFIFQPGEESAGGARLMIRDGAIDDVSAIFGFHGWPDLPLGHVGIKRGVLMAAAQDFYIEIEGKGTHGAAPHAGVDPLVVGAHVVTALQTIVGRRINPLDAAVVTVGQFHAGSSTNVISNVARMSGTLRAFSEETMELLRTRLSEIVTFTAKAHGAVAKLSFSDAPYPPLVNDSAITDFTERTVAELFGPEAVARLESPVMMAEDFAYYLQHVPGCFLYLGVNDNEAEPHAFPRLHSSRYDFPDEALRIGIELLVGLVLRYLDIAIKS